MSPHPVASEPEGRHPEPLWRRARLALLAGATLVLASLPWYVSYDNRAVLGRWSRPYALAMGAFAVLWLVTVWICFRRSRRHRPAGPASGAFDLAALAWGAAYLASTADDPLNAARLLDLNLLGSVAPPAVVLEWVALVLAASAAAVWIAPKLSRRLQNPALFFAALVAAGLLGEGVARGMALVAPAVASFPTWSLAQWYRRYVRFNRDGFRDSEHAIEAAPGVRRLLIVGDSYAFGWGVRDVADRLGEQVGARLREGTREQWEVINIAQPDRHTLQEIESLRRALAYRPEVVLLLYTFNDIDYLTAEFGYPPVTVRNVISESPRSLGDRIHPLRFIYWNSYAFQEVYGRIKVMGWSRKGSRRSGFDLFDQEPAILKHVGDLARFASLGESAGALVRIVPFDPRRTLNPATLASYRTFVARLEQAGVPVLSLADAFRPHTLEELTVSSIDRHPSALANRLAADALYPRLLDALRR